MDPTIARMEQDLKDLDRSIHTRTVYVQADLVPEADLVPIWFQVLILYTFRKV
ncbi:MAG: hypothetical protein H6747_04365 [Deltaproteobacteria bacterium]|nr:hypothetical protein [Deltaproteobacteria bacterium]